MVLFVLLSENKFQFPRSATRIQGQTCSWAYYQAIHAFRKNVLELHDKLENPKEYQNMEECLQDQTFLDEGTEGLSVYYFDAMGCYLELMPTRVKLEIEPQFILVGTLADVDDLICHGRGAIGDMLVATSQRVDMRNLPASCGFDVGTKFKLNLEEATGANLEQEDGSESGSINVYYSGSAYQSSDDDEKWFANNF